MPLDPSRHTKRRKDASWSPDAERAAKLRGASGLDESFGNESANSPPLCRRKVEPVAMTGTEDDLNPDGNQIDEACRDGPVFGLTIPKNTAGSGVERLHVRPCPRNYRALYRRRQALHTFRDRAAELIICAALKSKRAKNGCPTCQRETLPTAVFTEPTPGL